MIKHTQESQILAALRKGNILTPWSALERFNCFRLGARVYDLRRKGYAIQSRRAKGPAQYALYWMAPKDRRRKCS